jgi:CRISPR-associated Csx2 family protein
MGRIFKNRGERGMRKVFISFLGTNSYKKCRYEFQNENSVVVEFVQEALINFCCKDWGKEDKILIFLTKEAKMKNWEGKLELKIPSHLDCNVIDIPDGMNEKEIWEIFRIVFEQINKGDGIIYDITHSFRSLPMLGITLLNYAKFLKNIQVIGIYYGAFEVLGTAFEIENKIPNPENRIAPILTLTSFSILQDWTDASSEFTKYGITSNLKKLAGEKYLPVLKETQGQDKTAKLLQNLITNIDKISTLFQTSNGLEIIKSKKFDEVRELMSNYQDNELVPAFKPLLNFISLSIDKFEYNNIMNGFFAIEWCIKDNLIQQGFTLLQENIITFFASKLSLDYLDIKNRNDISSAYYY